MGFQIACYNARKITAEASHRNDSHWVEITIKDHGAYTEADDAVCTIFFHGRDAARLADEYAAAINGVNQPPVVSETVPFPRPCRGNRELT